MQCLGMTKTETAWPYRENSLDNVLRMPRSPVNLFRPRSLGQHSRSRKK